MEKTRVMARPAFRPPPTPTAKVSNCIHTNVTSEQGVQILLSGAHKDLIGGVLKRHGRKKVSAEAETVAETESES
jgi:hypothetical protein